MDNKKIDTVYQVNHTETPKLITENLSDDSTETPFEAETEHNLPEDKILQIDENEVFEAAAPTQSKNTMPNEVMDLHLINTPHKLHNINMINNIKFDMVPAVEDPKRTLAHCRSKLLPSEKFQNPIAKFEVTLASAIISNRQFKAKLKPKNSSFHGNIECNECGDNFLTRLELVRHLKWIHPNRRGQRCCNICKTRFTTDLLWADHIYERTILKNSLKQCVTCFVICWSWKCLVRHQTLHE